MPGSVPVASITTVMPKSFCSAFQRAEVWAADENRFVNGEFLAKELVANSRKSWDLTFPLPATLLVELRSFYQDRKGAMLPFYFYDLHEGAHDPAGVLANGRYACRFEGAWEEVWQVGRRPVRLQVVEIA